MRRPRARAYGTLLFRRRLDRGLRHLVLGHNRPSRQVLDYVAVSIARRKGHPGVDPTRVSPKNRLRFAGGLHEFRPVDAADLAQARDAVGHHELRERQVLRGTLHGLLDAHHLVRDPLLEPHQRREVGPPAADLLQEARQERRRE